MSTQTQLNMQKQNAASLIEIEISMAQRQIRIYNFFLYEREAIEPIKTKANINKMQSVVNEMQFLIYLYSFLFVVVVVSNREL